MDYEERERQVETRVREMLAPWMAAEFPGAAFELDVFDSDNGDDDWLLPIAANLTIPSAGVEDAYGLGDGAVGTVDAAAAWIVEQIQDEVREQRSTAEKRAAAPYRYVGPTLAAAGAGRVGVATGTVGRLTGASSEDTDGRRLVEFVPTWADGWLSVWLLADEVVAR